MAAALAACILAAWPAAGQGGDDARVDGEGPYRSRMRIVPESAAAPASLDPQRALEAAGDDPYARALVQRALGYDAAAGGDRATAIRRLRDALAAGALAPLAQAQMRADLIRLWAADDADADLADAYTAWRAEGHEFGATGHLSAARALARLERYAAAHEALRAALALTDDPPPGWREFEVFVLSRLARYAEAARVQAARLDLAAATREDWTNLVGLLMAAEDERGAAAAMELAVARGALDRPSDTETLARLYLQTGLPDHAAVLLQRQLDAGVLTGTAAHWRLLATAWLRAGDDVAAVAPLRELAARSDHARDDYRLGQVLARLQRHDEAAEALERAVRGDLGAELGRALLLLGEAHLLAGRERAARRAWTRAADLGGSYRQAQALLERLELSAAARAPEAAPADDAYAEVVPDAPQPGVVAAEAEPLERKTVPRQRFYYIADMVTFEGLPARAPDLTRQLRNAVRRERLSIAGPLQIITEGAGAAPDVPFELQIGVPVRSRVPPRGQFRTRDTEPFECVVRRFRGPAEALGEQWAAFAAAATAAGLTPSGETRTVVLDYSPGDGRHLFELQVGIAER